MTAKFAATAFKTGAKLWPDIGTPREIAEITGGTWTSEPYSPILAIRHRLDLMEENPPNFLFAPELLAEFSGPKARAALLTSGEAVSKGAVGLIVSARPRNLNPSFPCLIVDSPSRAIRKLAEYKRASSRAKFIAVTGSVGKTTTKNMVHHLASTIGPAHRSIANYNKGIGCIQFTLASLSALHRFSTAEFNEVRDLEEQIELYQPDVSILTNILWEHIDVVERQGYGGDQAIPRLAYLAAGVIRPMKQGGICVLNSDEQNFDTLSVEIKKSQHVEQRTFGSAIGNHVRIVEMNCNARGSDVVIEVEGKVHRYNLNLPGRHMAINSVAAATAVHFAGIDLSCVLDSFDSFQPEERRGVRSRIPWGDGHIVVRDESFSSSIPSLRSSFAQLELEPRSEGGRRIAVLGQIGDLGLSMPEALSELAHEVDHLEIDRFYTVGSDTRVLNENLSDRGRVAPHFQTLAQLEKALRDDLRPGDNVLLKGSDDPKVDLSLIGFVDLLSQRPAIKSLPPPTREPPVRLVIGGDTYFGEYYQQKRTQTSKINYLQTFGHDYCGERLAPLIQRADLAIVNLECTITEKTETKLDGGKNDLLRANPAETVSTLRKLGIGGVLLGNDHAMDHRVDGLADTLDALSMAGISVSGAGSNRWQAQAPICRQFDCSGIPFNVAVISGHKFNEQYDQMGFYAGSNSPGVNNINTLRLTEQVASLKTEGYYVILSPHWGTDYSQKSFEQAQMAKRLVKSGVDLILGHGSHVMNDVAMVDGVWVAYSLGDLIYNSESEYDRWGVLPFSLIAELEFARVGEAISGRMNLYPIVSCNQLTQFQPTFVDDDQFKQVSDALISNRYDRGRYLQDLTFGQRDGRHCVSVKLF